MKKTHRQRLCAFASWGGATQKTQSGSFQVSKEEAKTVSVRLERWRRAIPPAVAGVWTECDDTSETQRFVSAAEWPAETDRTDHAGRLFVRMMIP